MGQNSASVRKNYTQFDNAKNSQFAPRRSFFGCWFDMSSWKFEWGLTFKVREKVQFCISKLFYFPFSQHDNSFSLFLTIQIFYKILEHITIFLCFPFQVSSNFNMITYLTMDWTYRSVKETYGTMDWIYRSVQVHPQFW